VIRSFLAAVVVLAGIVSLGADLAQTAYLAAQTAHTVVLPPA
jgi:hypothetical protein